MPVLPYLCPTCPGQVGPGQPFLITGILLGVPYLPYFLNIRCPSRVENGGPSAMASAFSISHTYCHYPSQGQGSRALTPAERESLHLLRPTFTAQVGHR